MTDRQHDVLVVQKDAMPTRKMEAVGLAGAGVTVLVFLAALIDFPITIDVATAVVALITAGATFAAGYFRHERAGTATAGAPPPPTTTFPDDGPPPH